MEGMGRLFGIKDVTRLTPEDLGRLIIQMQHGLNTAEGKAAAAGTPWATAGTEQQCADVPDGSNNTQSAAEPAEGTSDSAGEAKMPHAQETSESTSSPWLSSTELGSWFRREDGAPTVTELIDRYVQTRHRTLHHSHGSSIKPGTWKFHPLCFCLRFLHRRPDHRQLPGSHRDGCPCFPTANRVRVWHSSP